MTGAITDPVDMPVPTHYIGICDECQSVKSFPTERARDLWERHHPHDDEVGNV
ncbi:hypothetical protein [Mycobacterium paragordonae]|uniref:hypothetical protein n=1 Tax=Mycobacterium paragordonae TaxID=1389713 RepID=UPI0014091E70|nr:hypothetical protein [Mycobacterium paragordonae]